MNKSFRKKLKKMLMLGTLIPMVCFIALFGYKYLNTYIQAETSLFKEDIKNVSNYTRQKYDKLNSLVDASFDFITDDEDDILKKAYLDELLSDDRILAYFFEYDGGVIVSTGYFNQEGYRISKSNDDNRFTLIVDPVTFSENIESLLTEKFDYRLSIDGYTVHDDLRDLEVYASTEILFSEKSLVGNVNDGQISITLLKHMEIEFNMLIKIAVTFLCLLLVLVVLIVHFMQFASKFLLKPLTNLTDVVSNLAIDVTAETTIETIEDEYKSIYSAFDEMILSMRDNMFKLQTKTDEFNEKNASMNAINTALENSLTSMEESTRKLQILENQTKTLVDQIRDLMWVVDSKGRITYINNVIFDKLGYEIESLKGVKLENLLVRDLYNEEAYQEIFSGHEQDIELRFVAKNNEHEEIYSCRIKRIYKNEKLQSIQGVCREVTEERFIESQLKQKQKISSTLNEIIEILTKPEKLEFLLKHIVLRIERLLDPLLCTIRLVDEKGRLELKAGIGEFFDLIQEKHLDIDNDISGRAIRESKIIIMTDKKSTDYDNYNEIHSVVEKAKELAFFPLEYDGTTIGVMSIGLREHLSESDLKILKVFTNQASAAIEKARMYEEIEHNYLNIIKALASTVEAKDTYTENHSIRVSTYARMIAEEMELSEEEIGYIDIAGLLHDIGKIGISDLILTKTGHLDDNEFMQIKKHPLNGGRIVSEMKLHRYIIDGVLFHHKRFDLKGYPEIDIDELPLSARIIGVADAFDAMTSNRSYQKARTFEIALEELKKGAGTQFCPEVVEIMEVVIVRLKRIAS